MKLLRTLALSGVLAAGTAGIVSLAPETAFGQAAKNPAPQPGAKGTTPAKPGEVKGKVLITKDKAGKFRFQIHDENDKTIAQSVKGYETVEEATKTVELVKLLLNTKKVEEEK
jgi:uncharacterized protein YegP (UPF0339 family)